MKPETPQLRIVGGPNGAGKSTFSGKLSRKGAVVFDADIIASRMKARLPVDVPIESIYFAVQTVFLDFVDDAIKNKQDFTIETNFRDNQLMDTIARFKQNGYETSMIYLTLNNVEQSIDRVKQRVNTGGHFVDENSVRYNFDEGLKNLDFFSDRFDHLEIFDASGNYGELNPLLSIKQQQLVYFSENVPDAVKQTVNNIADRYRNNFRAEDNDEEQDYNQGLSR
jgi:predicted ABC-type ATPase